MITIRRVQANGVLDHLGDNKVFIVNSDPPNTFRVLG